MTNGREAGWDRVGRTIGEIAQALESPQPIDARLHGALELVGQVVPYDRCALLEVEVGFAPRMLVHPPLSAEEESELSHELVKLFGRMLEERALAPASLALGAHLAVPLVGQDDIIGLLFVRRREGNYDKQNLRTLSLVAAQLAVGLSRLRASGELIGAAGEPLQLPRAAARTLPAHDTLAGLVARELETPLEAALAWVRLLGSAEPTAEARARGARLIDQCVRTQARLHADRLELAAAGGALVLALEPIEPARAVDAAAEALRPLAHERSIRFEVALDAAVGSLTADGRRLDGVLAALLGHALEETAGGGRVEVRLERTGEGAHARARIEVNGGPRLAARERSRSSDALSPSEARAGARTTGALALARHVIELHGGTLRAEPAARDRVSFVVELPQARE